MANETKVTRWKIERTMVWLSYIDSAVYLPSPLNLIEVLITLVRKLVRCCNGCCISSDDKDGNCDKEADNYNNLLDKIKTRYLEREKDSDTNAISLEDITNHKNDLLRQMKMVS